MKVASQPQVQQDLPDKTSTSKIDKEAKSVNVKLDVRLKI